jgi:hypothetical protein
MTNLDGNSDQFHYERKPVDSSLWKYLLVRTKDIFCQIQYNSVCKFRHFIQIHLFPQISITPCILKKKALRNKPQPCICDTYRWGTLLCSWIIAVIRLLLLLAIPPTLIYLLNFKDIKSTKNGNKLGLQIICEPVTFQKTWMLTNEKTCLVIRSDLSASHFNIQRNYYEKALQQVNVRTKYYTL